jgi:hypothetical protein
MDKTFKVIVSDSADIISGNQIVIFQLKSLSISELTLMASINNSLLLF